MLIRLRVVNRGHFTLLYRTATPSSYRCCYQQKPDAKHARFGPALQLANFRGFSKIVALLVASVADVNLQSGRVYILGVSDITAHVQDNPVRLNLPLFQSVCLCLTTKADSAFEHTVLV